MLLVGAAKLDAQFGWPVLRVNPRLYFFDLAVCQDAGCYVCQNHHNGNAIDALQRINIVGWFDLYKI